MKKTIVLSFIFLALLAGVLAAAEATTDPAPAYPKLKFVGFARVRYTVDAAAGKSDGFSIAQARVGISGDISETFSYTFSIEGTTIDGENRKLVYDAYIDTTLVPNFKVRFGQFKYGFGLEQTTPDADLELINKADAVSNLVKPTRDIGIQVAREIPLKALRPVVTVGFVNGSGSNLDDENDHKTWVGRLTVNPLPGLVIGGSLYDGTTGLNDDRKSRAGVDLKLEWRRWLWKGEFVSGRDKGVLKNGYYATVGYTACPGLVLLLRFDSWDANRAQPGLDTSRLTCGVNYFFTRNVLLRSNVEFRRETPALRNDVFMTQLQIKF